MRGASSARRLASAFGAILCASAYAAGCGDLIVPPESNPGQGDASGGSRDEDGGLPVDDLTDANGRAPDTGAPIDCAAQAAAFGAPTNLDCTGLYSDFAKRTLAPDVKEFDPGIHLWSDGAEKTRWMLLPPGSQIDTTDPNEWTFPIGFKVWKEFRISKRRIETRFYWKRGENDWVRTTYRWTDDESASVAMNDGQRNVGGTTYAIPTVAQCDACHSGRRDKMLGIEPVGFSTPESSYGGTKPAIAALVSARALKTAPPSLTIPEDSTGKARAALGWLHANCGTACHNPSNSSFAGSTGMFLRLEVGASGLGAVTDTNTWKTSRCVQARFTTDAPTPPGFWYRMAPGNVETSLIPFRDSRRDPGQETAFIQMPPIATAIPDLKGSKLVADWIAALPATPCP